MKTVFKLSAVSILLLSNSVNAASYAVDARGEAMGGTGTVAATYLTAPFYNPALTAIYRRNDDVGMLLPSLGLMFEDDDQMADGIDDLTDFIDNPTNYTGAEAQQILDNLDGAQAKVELGGAAAFGLPNPYLSATIFAKAYSESYIESDVYSEADVQVNAELSGIKAVSIGVTEVGISMAKYFNFLNQHMSIGISPKLQRIYTYSYTASADDYDFGDIKDSSNGETMFNMDAGALWFYGPLRVGFSAKNIFARDIETKRNATVIAHSNGTDSHEIVAHATYELEPQYTVGVGLVADYASLSVDYDLREEKKFTGFDDNTQMLRVGAEIDLMRQLYLRAGYKRNLVGSELDTITAGVGFAPLGLFELDIAASYTSEDAMGAYINFLATY